MPAILSENLDMGAFFMREKLKQFYIVLLVFILTIMGQYGHVLQTEAVFSTQKETVSAKSQTGKRLTGQKSEEKVYASGMPIGIYIKTEGILVLGLQQIDGKNSPALFRDFCKEELKLSEDEMKDRDLIAKEVMKWYYTRDAKRGGVDTKA